MNAFLYAYSRQLFSKVHYFVHLNFSISLLLANLVFVVGIDTAIGNRVSEPSVNFCCHNNVLFAWWQVGCAFVTVLLHYLFLAVFCWMLCEGVMLYLMLVAVFSSVTKKLWFFLLLGYCECSGL